MFKILFLIFCISTSIFVVEYHILIYHSSLYLRVNCVVEELLIDAEFMGTHEFVLLPLPHASYFLLLLQNLGHTRLTSLLGFMRHRKLFSILQIVYFKGVLVHQSFGVIIMLLYHLQLIGEVHIILPDHGSLSSYSFWKLNLIIIYLWHWPGLLIPGEDWLFQALRILVVQWLTKLGVLQVILMAVDLRQPPLLVVSEMLVVTGKELVLRTDIQILSHLCLLP